MENRTHVGDDALAYLLNVYLGVDLGEKLVCEAVSRGKRMLPVIRAFRECLPAIGLEPLPARVSGSGFFPLEAEEKILEGGNCFE